MFVPIVPTRWRQASSLGSWGFRAPTDRREPSGHALEPGQIVVNTAVGGDDDDDDDDALAGKLTANAEGGRDDRSAVAEVLAAPSYSTTSMVLQVRFRILPRIIRMSRVPQ